jgi:DNA excision repair protein ERCC-4
MKTETSERPRGPASMAWAPRIIVDTREQDPLPIRTGPVERGTLSSGDYSFAGGDHLFAVERKTIADLVQSLTSGRERFTRELERLRGYRFARLLVIGTPGQIEQGHYRSRTPPRAILHSLYSIEAKYVPVVFAATPVDGAALVERWAFWFARSLVEAGKKVIVTAPPSPVSTGEDIAGAPPGFRSARGRTVPEVPQTG